MAECWRACWTCSSRGCSRPSERCVARSGSERQLVLADQAFLSG
jgi:hypothetical protein